MKCAPVVACLLTLAALGFAPAAQAQNYVYVKCVYEGPREFAGIRVNFYVDEAGKRLLNDNKVEVGETRQWSADTITIARSRGNEAPQMTFINRRTGDLQTYTDGKQFETIKFGNCVRSLIPAQKF